jgi:uncharacterized cupin superfamily protein
MEVTVAKIAPAPPALAPSAVPATSVTNYPDPYKAVVAGRAKRRLGEALGLSNFGVNLTTLAPGAHSSLRHWHAAQDEFVYVLSGELTLITDAGAQVLVPGMAAGFPAGRADGHHLFNHTAAEAVYLEVGDRTAGDAVTYADADLQARLHEGRWAFLHKDGTPY